MYLCLLHLFSLFFQVRQDLDDRFSMIQSLTSRLKRNVTDFKALKYIIDVLGEVREMESWIEMDFLSIFSRYETLEKYLPKESMSKVCCCFFLCPFSKKL